MEKFIQKKSHLSEDEINELLYYYEQGISIGKEDVLLTVINNMIELNFDTKTISKITNKSEKQVLNYLN